jgi:CRISPR-associated protein Csb1
MPVDYERLKEVPRLLMEVELRPLQGDRFQPTGFPDLGPAAYTLPDGTEMLLVESAQSVANRMELACWDEANDDLIPELKGLPYIRIDCGELGKTSTFKEFHRLNSPYIWEGKETDAGKRFRHEFMADVGLKPTQRRKKKGQEEGDGEAEVPGVLDLHRFYRAVFKWDPNSVIHGVFLEKVAGRLRMTRALSGFIEARRVEPAESGGTKVDHILPSPGVIGLSAKTGYGNVPFHRTEFVAQNITAYFNLDLALLRSYGFEDEATKLLVALALFKIRRFLSAGLRLRTACDLRVSGDLKVTEPKDFVVPLESELLGECKRLIGACKENQLFADVTNVTWEPKPKSSKKGEGEESPASHSENEEEVQ